MRDTLLKLSQIGGWIMKEGEILDSKEFDARFLAWCKDMEGKPGETRKVPQQTKDFVRHNFDCGVMVWPIGWPRPGWSSQSADEYKRDHPHFPEQEPGFIERFNQQNEVHDGENE